MVTHYGATNNCNPSENEIFNIEQVIMTLTYRYIYVHICIYVLVPTISLKFMI